MPAYSTPIDESETDPIRRRKATRDERLAMHVMPHCCNMDIESIASQLGFARRTVYRLLHARITPTKTHNRSRKYKLQESDRRRLFTTATQDASHRRLPWKQVATICEIQAYKQTPRKVFHDAGYHRRIACCKPFLEAEAKHKQLVWALARADWTVKQWCRVLWTDKCYVRTTGLSGTVWVTRLVGKEFHEDCLVLKFPKKELYYGVGGNMRC